MKFLYLTVILSVFPIHAQQECEFKLYVDSLHAFSMEIPEQEEIIDKEGATYRYEAVESGNFKYSFDAKQKKQFSNSWLGYSDVLLSLQDINVDVDPTDSLLTFAIFKCRDKYFHKLTGVTKYYRIDDMNQWYKNNAIRILEFQRTLVYDQPDGSKIIENVGPRFFLHLITPKGDFVLDFNFYKYILKDDYQIAKKIVTSIKVLE